MKMPRVRTIWEDIIVHVTLTSEEMVLNVHVSLYIYKYIYIKEIVKKKRTKQIFPNILVLTFSLLLQIFRYNVYKCIIN